ncbi:MAG TPA: SDR family oxidoreductase [Steroidobacteraceae bacterium]|nr:SDR family oxidoreductase [Steroidobacteraceae bacterium]
MSKQRHAGRTMVITGGSSGIGQAMTLRLVSEGARVAVIDLADAGETIQLAAAAGGMVKGYQCDISDWAQMEQLGARIRADFGDPQLLVHCAAMQFMKPFDEITAQQWRATQQVNLDGGFHLVKMFLPAMKQAKWGRIVMVASSSYFAPPGGMSHYIASKGALIGFVRGLATELGGHGITVNALAPGLTRTRNAVASVPQAHFDYVVSHQAVKRSGEPEDQAGAVSFLLSDDAGFMSGQTLLVDGGEGHV